MRGAPIGLLILANLGLACRSPNSVPEPGAILLKVTCAPSVPYPDELRVWVYDDWGRLWDGVRLPEKGALANSQSLGTILIQPGTIRGALRVHIRGFAGGARILDGVLSVAISAGGKRTFDLLLDPPMPLDVDGDDVPDVIDDCKNLPNPMQGGCPATTGLDAAQPDVAPADAKPDTVPVDTQRDLVATDANVMAKADAAAPVEIDTSVPAPIDSQVDVSVPTPLDSQVDAMVPIPIDSQVDAGVAPAVDIAVDVANEARIDRPVPVDVGVADVGIDGIGPASVDGAREAEVSVDAAAIDAPIVDACEDAGTCNKPQGALCANNSECASGTCADGVCCTNACAGPCRSCNQPSATGVCQGYAAGSDPESECLSGSTCNGVGACGALSLDKANGQLCATAGECQSGYCRDGVCCDAACDGLCESCGTGTCQPVNKTDDIPECTGEKTCNKKGKCVAR